MIDVFKARAVIKYLISVEKDTRAMCKEWAPVPEEIRLTNLTWDTERDGLLEVSPKCYSSVLESINILNASSMLRPILSSAHAATQ